MDKMTTAGEDPGIVTALLAEVGRGAPNAQQDLFELVYGQLHRIATHQMSRERPDHTLQATALISEAYLRLIDPANPPTFANRAHFFSAAAKAMQRIRVDHARMAKALKRGGQWERECSREVAIVFDDDPLEVLAVHEALECLRRFDARKAELVTLRYFGGLTMDGCAEVLGISPRTAASEWQFAKAWLRSKLSMDELGGREQ